MVSHLTVMQILHIFEFCSASWLGQIKKCAETAKFKCDAIKNKPFTKNFELFFWFILLLNKAIRKSIILSFEVNCSFFLKFFAFKVKKRGGAICDTTTTTFTAPRLPLLVVQFFRLNIKEVGKRCGKPCDSSAVCSGTSHQRACVRYLKLGVPP